MIHVTIRGDAPKPLQGVVSKLIQESLESRGYVCVLDPSLQALTQKTTNDDYKQARGQDIFLGRED